MNQITEQPIATEPAAEEPGWTWAIVEIMGHRRHVGRTRSEEMFGAKMIRIDEPMFILKRGEGNSFPTKPLDPQIDRWETHYYSGGSLFSFTPTSEQTVMTLRKREATIEPAAQYRLTDQDTGGQLVLERNDADSGGDDDHGGDDEEHF